MSLLLVCLALRILTDFAWLLVLAILAIGVIGLVRVITAGAGHGLVTHPWDDVRRASQRLA